MRSRDRVATGSDRQGIARYTDVPLWLAALSVGSMLTVVAALVVIAGVLHTPWLGLAVGTTLFIALSTGVRRIARFRARSRSDRD
jgi:hypothetical protein